jgi:TolB-like protein/Tfp pilus assembly protein PilF
VAVLPLVNTGDPNIDFVSDGITEGLINSLSQLRELRVVARATVFRFKGPTVDPRAVGRQLGVSAVVTGKVTTQADTVAVQAEVVDVATGAQLWGDRYDRAETDLVALQADLARDISQVLQRRLSGDEEQRITRQPTRNSEAYRLYLTGRYHWNAATPDRLMLSVKYFQQAIDIEPTFALAHAGLADAYASLGGLAWVGLLPQDFMPKARAAAHRAIELDETLADAHASLGSVLWLFDWDRIGAERELRRAIELNANAAKAHSDYGSLLAANRRMDEAIRAHARALTLDPLSYWINASAAATYYFAGQPDRALEQAKKAIELDPKSVWGHIFAGNAYAQKGMLAEAIAEQQNGSNSALVHLLVKAGRRREAMAIVDRFVSIAQKQYVPPVVLAYMFTGIGDTERAFQWLEKAAAERASLLVFLQVDPAWASLRSDPRFDTLVRRIGLQ